MGASLQRLNQLSVTFGKTLVDAALKAAKER
jgi:hypothetical protein